jgi:energy-coupling factor transporter ATP-binding protein EcfA2
MKLKMSKNEYREETPYEIDQRIIKSGWEEVPVKIETEEDARSLFCEYHYSNNIWENGQRSIANFKYADTFVVDYDDSLTLDQAQERYSDYRYTIVTSKSHQIEKGGVISDRFHIIFPLESTITDAAYFSRAKHLPHFEGADKKTFESSRYFYRSPIDATIIVKNEGEMLDLKGLVEEYEQMLHATLDTLKKKPFSEYPTTVIDEYCIETPIQYFEQRALKASDLANKSVSESSKKFYCPLGEKCPTGGHNSASSYLVEMEDGSFIIKDFKHPETIIWKEIPLDVKCKDWFRIGAKFSEVIVDMGNNNISITRRGAEDVKIRLGENATPYIIRNKSLPETFQWNEMGGGLNDLEYKANKLGFNVFYPIPPTVIADNAFINDILEQWFAEHTNFIKDWIAYYTYTNHKNLPSLILTGPRGTGKSLFFEFVSGIYPKLSGRFDTKTSFTEHNGLKLAVLEEVDEFDNVSLYSLIKDVGGSSELIRNEKYGSKRIVKNNLNIIAVSNNCIPLYLKASELPTSEFNNQFFVYNFTPLMGSIDNQLHTKLKDRIGHWLRTEIKDRFDQLEQRSDKDSCRYLIPVPITNDERRLFLNNKTEIEMVIEEFLPKVEYAYITAKDLRNLESQSGFSFHRLKRKLVEMGVIKTITGDANRGKVHNIDGTIEQKCRVYHLAQAFWPKRNGVKR